MKLLRLFVVVLLGICGPVSLHAQYTNLFSELIPGARAMGLQGAYTAVANDYSSTFYNPAGIVNLHHVNFGFMHTQLPLNRTMDMMAVINPLSLRQAIGVSFGAFTVRDIEARQENSLTPDYTFDTYNRMVWLSYAYRITRFFSFGANVKFLFGKLDKHSSNGTGFDVGAKIALHERVSLGFMAQDIGTSQKWNTSTVEKFDTIYHLGLAVKPEEYLLLTSTIRQVGDEYLWSFGSELVLMQIIKVRSGLQDKNLSYGAGITLQMSSHLFVIVNYAHSSDPLIDGEPIQTFDFNVQLF